MVKKNSKYNAENVYHIVQGYRDTGINERILMQNTVDQYNQLLSNLLVPNKAQQAILKFANAIQFFDPSAENESSPESSKKKRVRYEDEIYMEEVAAGGEGVKKSVLDDFKTKDEKPQLRRSKSELYQGEKCVFDLFRDAQSYQFYQEILADYNKVPIGMSSIFSSQESGENKSPIIELQGSHLSRKGVAKVSILGSIVPETYKKKLEDEDRKLS